MNDQIGGARSVDRLERGLLEATHRIGREAGAEVILASTCLPFPSWYCTFGRRSELVEVIRPTAEKRRITCAATAELWFSLRQRKQPEDLLIESISQAVDFGHWLYFQALERPGC